MSQQNIQRPQTPPLAEIGDMDFNEAFCIKKSPIYNL